MSGVLAVSVLPAMPAQAAKKKLSVNKVYDTATVVKGKTKKKYQVRIRIGKMTYKSTASKKGNYSVKIPKQEAGKTLTVKAYFKKIFKSENLKNTPTPGPSYKDRIITEKGEPATLVPEQKDPKKHTASLPIKIVGYKNGKPVMAFYYCLKLDGAH